MPAYVFSGVIRPGDVEQTVTIGDGDAVELPGRFAVRGLVDAHCHFTVDHDEGGPFVSDAAFAAIRLEELGREGVTLLRDMGGRSEVTLDYARGAAPGLPLVLAAGRFHSTRGRYFPRMYTPTDPEELDDSLRTEIASGATWVKVIADFPPVVDGVPQPGVDRTYDDETLVRAVATAHASGARVAAHSTIDAAALVAAGVDSVEHGNGLTEADLDVLGARGGAWTPTIGAALQAVPPGAPPELVAAVEAVREHYRHHLSYAVKAGVTVMAGSDAVTTVAADVVALTQHGLTTDQALWAATEGRRGFLGISADDDLTTFDADPLEDPAVLASPVAVVIRGQRVV